MTAIARVPERHLTEQDSTPLPLYNHLEPYRFRIAELAIWPRFSQLETLKLLSGKGLIRNIIRLADTFNCPALNVILNLQLLVAVAVV